MFVDSSWNGLANFLRDMIAKYADELNFDDELDSNPTTSRIDNEPKIDDLEKFCWSIQDKLI